MFSGKETAKLTSRIGCKNDSAFMVEKNFPGRNLQPISTVIPRWSNDSEAYQKKSAENSKIVEEVSTMMIE